MSVSDSFVQIGDLTKRFSRVVAVDNVSLNIDKGAFVVLLGPSGCGKTTLLRCVAGLESPDEGEIRIGEKIVYSSAAGIVLPPGKRSIDMVFQSYALWPHMTTFDNIAFGLKLKRLPREQIRQRITGVLSDLGMEGLEKRYPFELSGGQQQRVALARLLANKPPVFLMDEPLSNLDARLRLDMRSELKRLHHDAGATTIYVTHDQTEALTMASWVVVMKDGVIQQIAEPNELYRSPENVFTAEFIGAPRINLLNVTGESVDGRAWLNGDGFRLAADWLPAQHQFIAAIRPENITLSDVETPEGVQFSVYAVLPAGPEVFVHVVRDDLTLVCRTPPGVNLAMDQTVWIGIDANNWNFYDKDTGQRIRPTN